MTEDETPETPAPAAKAKETAPPQAPAQEAPTSATALVKVTGPMWCTGFNFPQAGGGTLAIDRRGVEVATDLLPALKHSADKSGVTLSMEVSN